MASSQYVHYVHPRYLFFGHRSVSDHFSDGSPLEHLAFDLVAGNADVDEMEPIVVQRINSKRFVVDGNRRVCVFDHLRVACRYDVGKVPVVYASHSSSRVLVGEDKGHRVRIRGRGTEKVESEIERMASHAMKRSREYWGNPLPGFQKLNVR